MSSNTVNTGSGSSPCPGRAVSLKSLSSCTSSFISGQGGSSSGPKSAEFLSSEGVASAGFEVAVITFAVISSHSGRYRCDSWGGSSSSHVSGG